MRFVSPTVPNSLPFQWSVLAGGSLEVSKQMRVGFCMKSALRLINVQPQNFDSNHDTQKR